MSDIYREVKPSDYNVLAKFMHKNNLRKRGIWCKSKEDIGPEALRHSVEDAFHLGTLKTQIHEVDGKIQSFFMCFEALKRAVYSLAIVEPDLPNYKEVWCRDISKMASNSIKRGVVTFYAHLSNIDNEVITWIEKDIKMKRVNPFFVWKADTSVIQEWIDGIK